MEGEKVGRNEHGEQSPGQPACVLSLLSYALLAPASPAFRLQRGAGLGSGLTR